MVSSKSVSTTLKGKWFRNLSQFSQINQSNNIKYISLWNQQSKLYLTNNHKNSYHCNHINCHCYSKKYYNHSHSNISTLSHQNNTITKSLKCSLKYSSTHINDHKCKFHSSQHYNNDNEGGEQKQVKSKNEKITTIVNLIAELNLIEVAELVTELQHKLNLPNSAMMGGGMIAANTMQTQVATPIEEEEEPQQEQTIFDVILKEYPTDKKINVIKEVRQLFKLGLKEAKVLVEKAPCTLQTQCPKVDAETIRDKLKETGAVIELE